MLNKYEVIFVNPFGNIMGYYYVGRAIWLKDLSPPFGGGKSGFVSFKEVIPWVSHNYNTILVLKGGNI